MSILDTALALVLPVKPLPATAEQLRSAIQRIEAQLPELQQTAATAQTDYVANLAAGLPDPALEQAAETALAALRRADDQITALRAVLPQAEKAERQAQAERLVAAEEQKRRNYRHALGNDGRKLLDLARDLERRLDRLVETRRKFADLASKLGIQLGEYSGPQRFIDERLAGRSGLSDEIADYPAAVERFLIRAKQAADEQPAYTLAEAIADLEWRPRERPNATQPIEQDQLPVGYVSHSFMTPGTHSVSVAPAGGLPRYAQPPEPETVPGIDGRPMAFPPVAQSPAATVDPLDLSEPLESDASSPAPATPADGENYEQTLEWAIHRDPLMGSLAEEADLGQAS